MEKPSLSPSAVDDATPDPTQSVHDNEVARLLRLVGEQNDTIAVLQAMMARVESELNGAQEAREKALVDASSRVSELGTLIDSRAREVEKLQKELSDQCRLVTSLQSSLRVAERDKDGANTKLYAFQESAAEVKRAYESRALALEQSNTTLLRTEAAALENAKDARALADSRREEVEKSQHVMAQTFRDFHAMQTAYYALQLEAQRTATTAKADAAHALDMRRSLEERVKLLNEENKGMRVQQAETGHHLTRLADSITVHHQTQIGRFDTAVAYLGSLLKSPFVRWSLLWRMRRANNSDVRPDAQAPSIRQTSSDPKKLP